jgi:hypothetical protein
MGDLGFDFGFVWGMDPRALGIDVGEYVNGAEHVTSGGQYGVSVLDDVTESKAQATVARFEKP